MYKSKKRKPATKPVRTGPHPMAAANKARRASYAVAKKLGFRSGLEVKMQEYLQENAIEFEYESIKIEWEDKCLRKYTPDFILTNGVIVETKGRFTAQDRRKHLAIAKQHPGIDIRFVFENAKRKISKVSGTSYADWCEKHGFKYANKVVPLEWAQELPRIIPINERKIICFKPTISA